MKLREAERNGQLGQNGGGEAMSRGSKIDGRRRLQCGIPTQVTGAEADHAKDGQTSSSSTQDSTGRNRKEWKNLGEELNKKEL